MAPIRLYSSAIPFYTGAMGISKLHKKIKIQDTGNQASKAGKSPLTLAREVLLIEAREVEALAQRLDDTFLRAVELILQCRGRVVVTAWANPASRKNRFTLRPATSFLCTRRASLRLGMITQAMCHCASTCEATMLAIASSKTYGHRLISIADPSAMAQNPTSILMRRLQEAARSDLHQPPHTAMWPWASPAVTVRISAIFSGGFARFHRRTLGGAAILCAM